MSIDGAAGQLPLLNENGLLDRLRQAEQTALDLKYRAEVLEREVRLLQAIVRGRAATATSF